VLVLRMEETLIGAVLGGLAALVLVPARSSPLVRDAEAEMLDRLADLLQAIRRRRGSGSALRELDSAFQTVRDVTRPVSQGVPGTAARRIEQRVYALSAAAYSARMLVTALLRVPDTGELTDRLEQLTTRTEKLAARAHDGVEDLSSLADEKTGGHPAHEDLASTGEAHAHAHVHVHAADPGDADGRARMHARVALERLDLALSRWCDPLRPPATGAGPSGSAGRSTGSSAAVDGRLDDVPAPDRTAHPTGATRATADLPLR
jgi:gas vesicle protein